MDRTPKQIAIELTDVSIDAGPTAILRHVGAQLYRGELIALVGRNGTGKSTLINTIAGIHKTYDGNVTLIGNTNPSAKERAALMAYVSTGRVRVQSMLVKELVALGRYPYTSWKGHLNSADRAAVDEALKATGIADKASRSIDSLSDGEAQRAMVARAIAQNTPIMLLDEPTSFLDIPGRAALCRLLKNLAGEGRCVVFTTHELNLAAEFADRLAFIDNYNLTVDTPQALMPRINQRFGL